MLREELLVGLAILLGVAVTQCRADELRVEGSLGKCQHHLAPDASWHYQYGGYETNMGLRPTCGQLGLLWKQDKTFGWRVAYVDLGHVRANNTYPVVETAYFVAKDTKTSVDSPTARFQGTGNSRGFTFGPAFEWKFRRLTAGAEVGLAALYNTWSAMAPGLDEWHYADGWNSTYYLGLNARYEWLQAGLRIYRNVHASQADENPLFVGPTSGPVVAAMVGVSVEIK